MTDQTKDIGDYLEVPEGERLDEDPAPEFNADAGFDIEVVPDGVVVELESAGDDERAPLQVSDDGDGAPLQFISEADPMNEEED